MNEMTKTLAFVAVAAVTLIAAISTQPSSADLDKEELVGEIIGNFDPEAAKQLKIVAFDEDTATIRDFEVAQDEEGLWTLPSKDGYPADAERQMGEAAGTLLDREILAVATNSAAEHEQYGVIDPDPSKLEVGEKGVGTRVTVSDISGDPLIDLIVGKEVKEAEGQRYVREAKRDLVYVIEIDPEPLSTKFEDWIESDLLQLNSWDIRQVAINDYSAELVLVGFQPQIEWDRRGEYELRYDDSDSKWIADSLKMYDRDSQTFVESPLAENEELDEDKLRELKSALDDLKIVDVEKKPSGLSANLKAGEDFLNDNQAISSLVQRGFAAVPLKSNELEILSSEGEVICTMKNGVEYVLRFGNLQVDASAGEAGQQETEEGTETDDGVSRYLFAMVRFNEDAVQKPELAELPELPADVEEGEDGSDETDADGASAAGGEVASGDEATAEEETAADDDAATEDGATDGDEASTNEGAENDGENEQNATDEQVESNDAADEATGDSADDSESADDSASDADGAADGEESVTEESDSLEDIIAERKRLEEENQRKLDDYKEQLDEGREKVKDLNLRFGDWYYVISNDVFRKIRLSREDIVKEKEPEEDEQSTDDEASDDGASAFGAPGAANPGVPDIPEVSVDTDDDEVSVDTDDDEE